MTVTLLDLLEQGAGEGVEISLSGPAAVGVLVPCTDPALWRAFARLWQPGSAPAAPGRRRAVRCDLAVAAPGAWAWQSLTWYHGGGPDLAVPGISRPADLVAERWSRKERESSAYLNTIATARSELAGLAAALAARAGLPPHLCPVAATWADRAARLGLVSTVAATISGDHRRCKLAVATDRLADVTAATRTDVPDAPDIARRFRRLRWRLGYAGITLDAAARVSLRLYTRPMPARLLRSALHDLARSK